MPNMRPQFGKRILIVGATWGILAAIARLAGPGPAMVLSLIPLGLAARSAWRTHASSKHVSMEQLLQRQVSTVAMLIAAGLFAATLWSIRDRVPLWAIPMEIGMLVHYWLVTLS
ncbi:MAG TPA: hypothetical protein VD969_18450 [Symbiobacteriaceae bacterium]|nr:hypothetical protein [Symbiobacteriaceae bacterium]